MGKNYHFDTQIFKNLQLPWLRHCLSTLGVVYMGYVLKPSQIFLNWFSSLTHYHQSHLKLLITLLFFTWNAVLFWSLDIHPSLFLNCEHSRQWRLHFVQRLGHKAFCRCCICWTWVGMDRKARRLIMFHCFERCHLLMQHRHIICRH